MLAKQTPSANPNRVLLRIYDGKAAGEVEKYDSALYWGQVDENGKLVACYEDVVPRDKATKERQGEAA